MRANKQSTPNYEPVAVVWDRCVLPQLSAGTFSAKTGYKCLLRQAIRNFTFVLLDLVRPAVMWISSTLRWATFPTLVNSSLHVRDYQR